MNVDDLEDSSDEELEGDPEEFDPEEEGGELELEDDDDLGEAEGAPLPPIVAGGTEDGDDAEVSLDPDEAAELADRGGPKAPLEEEEEEEEILFADKPVPTKAALRKALAWAFEGEDAPEEFLDRCAEHAVLVQKGNRRMNLTKIVEPKEIAAKHYLDAWRTTRQLSLLGRSVLDIGTGAGYPAVPIALGEPNCLVTAMDSTRKKADFVRESCEKLGIANLTVEWGRAEEWLLRNRVDVVVMRAISSVRENVRLLRKVRHSLQDLVMMKGPSWSREVRAGEREAERLGFRLDTIVEHELPGELGGRAILVYRAPGGQGR